MAKKDKQNIEVLDDEVTEQEPQTEAQEPQQEPQTQAQEAIHIDIEDLSQKVSEKIAKKINRQNNEKAQKVKVETQSENVKDDSSFIFSILGIVTFGVIAIFTLTKLRNNAANEQQETMDDNSVNNSNEYSSVYSHLIQG